MYPFFFYHNGIKLAINNRKKAGKINRRVEIKKNTVLNNQWIKKEIKGETKKNLK